MPWFMNPKRTCLVMNRLATKFSYTQQDQLRQELDKATELLWDKVSNYYANNAHH